MTKSQWIESLKSQDQIPEIVILEKVKISEWQAKEKWWIKKLKHLGLFNKHCGGNGTGTGKSKAEFTYIYGIKDPNTNIIKYVGKSNRPIIRFRLHLFTNSNSSKKLFSISLEEESIKKIDEIAKKENRSRSNLIETWTEERLKERNKNG